MNILIILMIILLFVLLTLVLIILAPIDYYIFCSKYESFTVFGDANCLFKGIGVSFQWKQENDPQAIFKILGIPIKLKTNKLSQKKKRTNSKNKDKHDNKTKSKNKTDTEDKSNSKKQFSLKTNLELAKKLLQHILPKTLKINGCFGFDDPAATGMLCALLNLLPSLFPQSRLSLSYTPVFDEQILEGEVAIKGRLIPVVMLWIILSQKRKEKKHA